VTAALLALVTLAIELVISNYAWKHLKQLQKTTFARPIVVTLVGAFFFSHLTHIWADAELDYNVLRQDTVMPLSYPTTAKTLLTKYGMFNQSDYVQRTTSQLSFSDPVPNYPSLSSQCTWAPTSQSVFMVLTKSMLTDRQIEQFSQRSVATNLKLQHHIDNALYDDAWFNLLYSLPSIYQQDILNQQTKPLLFQALDKFKLAKSLTVVKSDSEQSKPGLWFDALFDKTTRVRDISSLIFADKFNSMAPGLHLIYFDDSDSYQYELFVDALLLAQKQKADRDIIWLSSIGNDNSKTGLTIKPALLVWPKTKNTNLKHLTSHMDLQGSLMKNWLSCDLDAHAYPNSADLLRLNEDRVIANTMVDGIMVFNKDKSMFVDQDGAFRSSSRQLEQVISVSADLPLMIDGVHFIKRFSQNVAQKPDMEHEI
jgi:membrane-anchored protein YejM (alkaline phosphatase superfamily)